MPIRKPGLHLDPLLYLLNTVLKMPWKSFNTIALIVQPFFWGHLGKLIERLWEVGKLGLVVVAKTMVTNMLAKMMVAMVVVAKSRCKVAPVLLDLP